MFLVCIGKTRIDTHRNADKIKLNRSIHSSPLIKTAMQILIQRDKKNEKHKRHADCWCFRPVFRRQQRQPRQFYAPTFCMAVIGSVVAVQTGPKTRQFDVCIVTRFHFCLCLSPSATVAISFAPPLLRATCVYVIDIAANRTQLSIFRVAATCLSLETRAETISKVFKFGLCYIRR